VGEKFSGALQGKRVVVTRAAEQSETLIQALREQGAVPMLAPMVAFAPPDDANALDSLLQGTERYDWLLLTSQNALRALQERCERLGIMLAQRMSGIRIATVGPATAEAAKGASLEVEYVAATRNGAALAQELSGKIEGKRILLPRSDKANPELVEKLEASGATVNEIIAYKTIPPEGKGLVEAKRAVSEGVDAVLFFSPSAVDHLRDILGKEKFHSLSRQALFAAIGPVTEKALHKAKVERVVVAADVTTGAVIAALTEYFSANAAKLPAGANPE
jgi:uroporphyrinogen-III synthase